MGGERRLLREKRQCPRGNTAGAAGRAESKHARFPGMFLKAISFQVTFTDEIITKTIMKRY